MEAKDGGAAAPNAPANPEDGRAVGVGRAAAVARLPDRTAFLGLGLIGGSIALALREAGYGGRLVAWTPEGRGPSEGVRRGLLDDAPPGAAAAIAGAGLVVIAAPPLAAVRIVESLGGALRESLEAGATVTDVVSTKGVMVAAADAAGLRFVGGHPMAGRETTGVESATVDLFVDRPWVVVPGSKAGVQDVERVEALATAARARPVRLSAADHDAAVAAISHLPLVLSAALAESVALGTGSDGWPAARALAASGWRDMTRLARGDAEMGAGILATNADAVVDRLTALRDVIDDWIRRLGAEQADPEGLRARLQAAREALDGELS